MRIHFKRLAEEGPREAAWNDVTELVVDAGTIVPLRITEVNKGGKAHLRIERATGEHIALVPMGNVPAVD